MQVRQAKEADLKEIQALLRRAWHSTYDNIYGVETVDEISGNWHSIPSLKAALERTYGQFLLCEETSVLGMAYATLDGATIMLHQLYVDPVCQGRGVGSALHEAVINSFPQARSISLEVEPQNLQAIRFYKKFGYNKVGNTDNCGTPDSGISAVIFELHLA